MYLNYTYLIFKSIKVNDRCAFIDISVSVEVWQTEAYSKSESPKCFNKVRSENLSSLNDTADLFESTSTWNFLLSYGLYALKYLKANKLTPIHVKTENQTYKLIVLKRQSLYQLMGTHIAIRGELILLCNKKSVLVGRSAKIKMLSIHLNTKTDTETCFSSF